MPASAELENFVKTLHYMADRFGEMGEALSEAPSRDTFAVQLEQLNLLKMGVDLAFGRTDPTAKDAFAYKKVYNWTFAEFAADFDKVFNLAAPKLSLFEHDWPIAVLKDAPDPVARMTSWVQIMRVMPQSFALPVDHLASELGFAEYVFNTVAERSEGTDEAYVVAKEYADANLLWVARLKPAVEGLEDGPVKEMMRLYIEVIENWEAVFKGYQALLAR